MPLIAVRVRISARLEGTLAASLKPGARGADGVDPNERARILESVKGWRQRCSTLLCETHAGIGTEACAAPSTSLLTELAAIDGLSQGLAQRTAQCSAGAARRRGASLRSRPPMRSSVATGLEASGRKSLRPSPASGARSRPGSCSTRSRRSAMRC
ncbi:MAG: hypothetical protein U1E87_05700 [Alphaproteobacteria bacterium]